MTIHSDDTSSTWQHSIKGHATEKRDRERAMLPTQWMAIIQFSVISASISGQTAEMLSNSLGTRHCSISITSCLPLRLLCMSPSN